MSKKKKSRRLNQPMAAAEHRAAPLMVHWGRALPGRPHPSRPRSLVEHRLQFQFVLFTILKVAGGKKKKYIRIFALGGLLAAVLLFSRASSDGGVVRQPHSPRCFAERESIFLPPPCAFSSPPFSHP